MWSSAYRQKVVISPDTKVCLFANLKGGHLLLKQKCGRHRLKLLLHNQVTDWQSVFSVGTLVTKVSAKCIEKKQQVCAFKTLEPHNKNSAIWMIGLQQLVEAKPEHYCMSWRAAKVGVAG